MEESTQSGAINLWQGSDSWTNIKSTKIDSDIFRSREFFLEEIFECVAGMCWECGWTVTVFLYPVAGETVIVYV